MVPLSQKAEWSPTHGEHDPKLSKAAQKQAAHDAKAQAKADAKAAKQAERDAKMARYKQLRANVRRRRVLYVLFIVLAIGVFAGSVWDILYNDSDFMWYVFAAYAVLFLWGLLLLFSRRKHLEEVEEMLNLERVFLEDPGSGEVFQISANKLPALVGAEFSSPITGEFYAMPDLDAKQVERVLPEGRLQSRRFERGDLKGEVATFGKEPREIQFK